MKHILRIPKKLIALISLMMVFILLLPITAQASNTLTTLQEFRDYLYRHVQRSEVTIIVNVSNDLFDELIKDTMLI